MVEKYVIQNKAWLFDYFL